MDVCLLMKRVSQGASLLFAVVFLGACFDEPRSPDYRVNHPVKVSKETVAQILRLQPPFDTVAPRDQFHLDRFFQDYVRRGRGTITVLVTEVEGDQDGTKSRMDQVEQVLLNTGFRTGEYLVLPQPAGPGRDYTARLTFTGHVATIPDCQNIPRDSLFNNTNRYGATFGCSFQRALGANVADPGDLKNATATSAPSTQRSVDVVIKRRQGKSTVSEQSPAQAGSLIGGGNNGGGN